MNNHLLIISDELKTYLIVLIKNGVYKRKTILIFPNISSELQIVKFIK